MSIKLNIKSELPTAIKWTNQHTKQLPYSIAQSLTAISKGLKYIPQSQNKSIISDFRRLAEKKLDRPKKQTTTGWFATTARKTDLKTVISPKDTPWNRNPYVKGLMKGGDRPAKYIELEARKLSSLPSNIDLVPTRNTPRDAYGNPKRAFVKRHLSNVGSGKTFIGKPEGTTRPIGIYQVKGSSLTALFVGQSSTDYPAPFKGLEKKAYARAQQLFGKYLRMRLEANVRSSIKLRK